MHAPEESLDKPAHNPLKIHNVYEKYFQGLKPALYSL